MKIITYEETLERANDGLIVVVAPTGDFEDEIGNILIPDDLNRYKGNDKALFGYNEEAENEAEAIFDSLREEVKDYLHRFLVIENWPSW